jgi:hypothetical protein
MAGEMELRLEAEMAEDESELEAEIPGEVWSSGMEWKIDGKSEITSSCRGDVVIQDMATVMDGRVEPVPERKVRVMEDQSMIGLVSRSQGSPSTTSADGWSFVTRRDNC